MEIIYELLTEKSTFRIAWGQMLAAVLLALLLAGLCREISVQNGGIREGRKEYAGLAETDKTNAGSEERGLLSEGFLEDYDGRIDPELIAADTGPAVQKKDFVEKAVPGRKERSGKEKEKTSAEAHSSKMVVPKAEKGTAGNKTAALPEETVTDPVKGIDSDIAENTDGSIKGDTGEAEEDTAAPAAILSVELYGNGGTPESITDSCNAEEFSIETYETPARMGKLFDGWYYDRECKEPFSKVEPEQTSLILYAGWKEFPGFLCNDKGYITGYTDASLFLEDSLLVFPRYDTCVGIEKNALKGLEEAVTEIYIPANISHIESGAFDDLTNLAFIEVHPKNKSFYSKDGILYDKNGDVAALPNRMRNP